ncbi:hypothetical protein [Thiobacillus sp.]|jgi:cation:H+ antiporter|uniref:hypothetical protein n=1 Tax=Thiobacillus sp. TaxID=924 RepID=UPI0025EF986E|nr:hypothetical protein [Thiobacillus sp.]
MQEIAFIWASLFACLAVIGVAGVRLSRYGDILAIDDLAYLPGPLLADVSLTHAASAFSAMMMSGLAVVGLVLRPASRVFRTVSWISLLLLVIYLLNTLFLYLHGD